MRPAIGYIRVSTAKQGRSGLGIEAQQEALQRFAEAEGYRFAETFTEVESGKAAMKRAKARGVRIGGLRAKGIELEREAQERAEGLRSVFEGLSGLSARKAAEKLNADGVPTPAGGKWHATQVIRVRERLSQRAQINSKKQRRLRYHAVTGWMPEP